MKAINKFSKTTIAFVVVAIIGSFALLLWITSTANLETVSVISIAIAAVAAIFAAVSSYANLLQAMETKRQREYFERPNVLVFFEGTHGGGFYCVVQNIGNTPAIDTQIRFDPAPIDYAGRPLSEISLFSQPICFLPPGRSIRQIIDAGFRMFDNGRPTKFTVTTNYKSMHSIDYKETREHNIEYLRQTTVPPKSLEEELATISSHLGEIKSNIQRTASISNGFINELDHYLLKTNKLILVKKINRKRIRLIPNN